MINSGKRKPSEYPKTINGKIGNQRITIQVKFDNRIIGRIIKSKNKEAKRRAFNNTDGVFAKIKIFFKPNFYSEYEKRKILGEILSETLERKICPKPKPF